MVFLSCWNEQYCSCITKQKNKDIAKQPFHCEKEAISGKYSAFTPFHWHNYNEPEQSILQQSSYSYTHSPTLYTQFIFLWPARTFESFSHSYASMDLWFLKICFIGVLLLCTYIPPNTKEHKEASFFYQYSFILFKTAKTTTNIEGSTMPHTQPPWQMHIHHCTTKQLWHIQNHPIKNATISLLQFSLISYKGDG